MAGLARFLHKILVLIIDGHNQKSVSPLLPVSLRPDARPDSVIETNA